MHLSSFPVILLSSIVCNGIGSLAIQGAPASAPAPKQGGIIGAIKGALGPPNGAPPNLLQYQKDHADKLKGRVNDLRKIALNDKNIPGDVQAYAQNKLSGHSWKGMQGVKLRGGTVFTHYARKEKANILHATKNCYVIMNGKSPFVHSYGPLRQSNAGQSFFHFLVIPRANVYNAVIFQDDFWIKESKAAFDEFLRKPDWHAKAVARVRHYVKHTGLKAGDDKLITDLAAKSAKLKSGDFAFAYHTGTDASIGHLHMHVVAADAALRAQSSQQHDEKDAPPEAILAVMKADPISNYKLWTKNLIVQANHPPMGGKGGKKRGKKARGKAKNQH